MDKDTKPRFQIITPVRNASWFISNCIAGVRNQTYKNFQQIIIDDASTDSTVQDALHEINGDPRIRLIQNKERVGVPLNHRKGVESSYALSGDIIVHLDGDDWFHGDDVLEKVAKVYEETDCWMTYGNYVTTDGSPSVAREYTGSPKQAVLDGWPYSHLRTFKRHCWEYLTDEDFRDSHGKYYTAAADVVIFVPMLKHIPLSKRQFIDEPLVVYNLSTTDNEHKINPQEQVRTALDVIRK